MQQAVDTLAAAGVRATMKALLAKPRSYLDGYVWRRVTGAAPVIRLAA
ncbi:Hypothetical protein A7982_05497 [Minicystis rosea]|nr:Hypothetical protein A7982_05497 [Minicystis rosea]